MSWKIKAPYKRSWPHCDALARSDEVKGAKKYGGVIFHEGSSESDGILGFGHQQPRISSSRGWPKKLLRFSYWYVVVSVCGYG